MATGHRRSRAAVDPKRKDPPPFPYPLGLLPPLLPPPLPAQSRPLTLLHWLGHRAAASATAAGGASARLGRRRCWPAALFFGKAHGGLTSRWRGAGGGIDAGGPSWSPLPVLAVQAHCRARRGLGGQTLHAGKRGSRLGGGEVAAAAAVAAERVGAAVETAVAAVTAAARGGGVHSTRRLLRFPRPYAFPSPPPSLPLLLGQLPPGGLLDATAQPSTLVPLWPPARPRGGGSRRLMEQGRRRRGGRK